MFSVRSLEFLHHKMPPCEAAPPQSGAFARPEQLLFLFDFMFAFEYVFNQSSQSDSHHMIFMMIHCDGPLISNC